MKMTFAFGRFNPSTIGHEVLMDKAKSVGGKNYRIYISQSQDRKKNPLDYSTKLYYMRKMFPRHKTHIINSPARTAIDVAVELFNEGFTDIIFIAGSDRVTEFDALLQKYNGVKAKHGEYKFDSIKVISAGERDPDAEGASGMSASKMRKAAVDGDEDKFKEGLPPKFAASGDSKKLFRAVQKAMGIKSMNEWVYAIPDYPAQLDKEDDDGEWITGDPPKPIVGFGKYVDTKKAIDKANKDIKKDRAVVETYDEGILGRTLKKKSYATAVGYYKKFKQRGDSSGVALHKAASLIQGLNDRDLNRYLQKNKVL